MVLDSAYNRRGNNSYAGGNDPLLKLLVPNYVAGALLGKGGTLLPDLKSDYQVDIRLSGGNDYYPGTDERIVVITGDADRICELNDLIMEKLHDPGRDSSMKNISIDSDRAEKVKIVLTDGAAGLLIGRGGSTIQGIQKESRACISVAMPERATVFGERVVTVSGNIDERTEACRQIIKKIAEEPTNMTNNKTQYSSNTNDVYNNGGYDSNGMLPPFNTRQQTNSNTKPMSTYRGNAMASSQSYPQQNQSSKLEARVEIQVDIPNGFVGGVLGQQGSIIKDFVKRSGGAKFRFSEQTDESEYRTLTMTGDMDQTQAAYSLVNDRIDQLRREVCVHNQHNQH